MSSTSLSPVEILRRLVAIDSTSSRDTGEIATFIANYADRPGIAIEHHPTPAVGKSNLVLSMGPAVDPERRDGLVLCGHLDTVPADEPDWSSDPFSLTTTEDGDAWTGRGTADMKGFLALALDRFVTTDPDSLTAPLELLFTCDEELGSLGAQALLDRISPGLIPRAVVIGEPTSLRVARMHKGHLRLRLELVGQRAHSGFPHRGSNAIEAAGLALTALTDLRRRLETADATEGAIDSGVFAQFPDTPFVTLNLGRISGGGAVNVIPDRCVVDIGMRPLPGMVSAEIFDRVRRHLATALAPTVDSNHWSLETVNDSPPLLTSADSEIYRVLTSLTADTAGAATSFASDGGTLQKLDTDCVLFGPGSIEVAHRADEFLPRAEFELAGNLLRRLIDHCCVSS